MSCTSFQINSILGLQCLGQPNGAIQNPLSQFFPNLYSDLNKILKRKFPNYLKMQKKSLPNPQNYGDRLVSVPEVSKPDHLLYNEANLSSFSNSVLNQYLIRYSPNTLITSDQNRNRESFIQLILGVYLIHNDTFY